MNKKTIWIIPFKGEKEKWHMWSVNFVARVGIKRYHVLLTGAKTIPADDKDKTKEKEIDKLKILNFTAYNNLILAQEDTVYFEINKEAKANGNKYRN